MKKGIFVIMLTASSIYQVFSQTTSLSGTGENIQTDTLKNKIPYKKWGIAININTVEPASDAGFDYNALSQRTFVNGHRTDKSFCIGLYVSYRTKENFHLRLSSKVTNYNIVETRDFREFEPKSSDYELANLEAKQSMFLIAPGIIGEFNFKKITLYGGGQLVYRQYGAIKGNTSYSVTYYSNDSTYGYQKYYQTEPGGFSLGVGPIIGFSVKIFKGTFIGSEFSNTYSYYKTGGAITTQKTNILPIYADGGTTVSGQTFQGFKFSSLLTSINIVVSF